MADAMVDLLVDVMAVLLDISWVYLLAAALAVVRVEKLVASKADAMAD